MKWGHLSTSPGTSPAVRGVLVDLPVRIQNRGRVTSAKSARRSIPSDSKVVFCIPYKSYYIYSRMTIFVWYMCIYIYTHTCVYVVYIYIWFPYGFAYMFQERYETIKPNFDIWVCGSPQEPQAPWLAIASCSATVTLNFRASGADQPSLDRLKVLPPRKSSGSSVWSKLTLLLGWNWAVKRLSWDDWLLKTEQIFRNANIYL